MKLSQLAFLVIATLLLASSDGRAAQTLSSIDFTPLEGTAWGDSTVRLDFGEGMGMGTVTFTSLSGGSFYNAQTPFGYNAAPYSAYNGPTTLGSGALFSPTQESVFTILSGSGLGLSGFSMLVTLDSGIFTEGSVFSVRSMGRNDALSAFQYVSPISGLSAPDSAQLPTDGASNVDWALLDAGLNLYGASANGGASRGMALGITGSSFQVDFLTTPDYTTTAEPGGMAFTVAVAPVPEPSTMVLIGLGVLLCLRRQRQLSSAN